VRRYPVCVGNGKEGKRTTCSSSRRALPRIAGATQRAWCPRSRTMVASISTQATTPFCTGRYTSVKRPTRRDCTIRSRFRVDLTSPRKPWYRPLRHAYLPCEKRDMRMERHGKPPRSTIYLLLCGALFCCIASPAFARRKHVAAIAAPAPMVEGRRASTVLRMPATALGWQAGYGIVAVDPRVIPLRTRLYIPGYGYAVAGDTGGAIRGSRIDLGFNTYRDARQFGRRNVTVYLLQ
jgi:3D (Asp-Asp-Asp) domain-containing protein